jgi:hypothetical protein
VRGRRWSGAGLLSAAAALLFCLTAMGQPRPPEMVAGYRLKMVERDGGRCAMEYRMPGGRNGVVELAVAPPCALVHRTPAKVQSYTYRDLGGATVVMVTGGPAAQNRRDPGSGAPCGTRAQAILLRRASVTASPKVAEGSVYCPSVAFDEVMFSFHAHAR